MPTYSEKEEYVLPEWVRKPISQCYICMSSVYGVFDTFSVYLGCYRHIFGLLMVLSMHFRSTYSVFDTFSVGLWCFRYPFRSDFGVINVLLARLWWFWSVPEPYDKLLGILTFREVISALAKHHGKLDGLQVNSVMNATPLTCNMETEIPEGDCWGVIGGMLKDGKSFKENALIELEEEMGYNGPIELHHALQWKVRGFTYQNFLGVVPEPFPLAPTDPEFAKETSFIEWMPFSKVYELVDLSPYQFHKGLLRLLIEN